MASSDALNADLAEIAVTTCRELGEYIFLAAGSQCLFDITWVDPYEL
jgi:hypothetical protein